MRIKFAVAFLVSLYSSATLAGIGMYEVGGGVYLFDDIQGRVSFCSDPIHYDLNSYNQIGACAQITTIPLSASGYIVKTTDGHLIIRNKDNNGIYQCTATYKGPSHNYNNGYPLTYSDGDPVPTGKCKKIGTI